VSFEDLVLNKMIVSLTSISVPNDEEVKHKEINTTAFVKDFNLGKGTLIVAKSRYSFILFIISISKLFFKSFYNNNNNVNNV
jgi:hypothetical protein